MKETFNSKYVLSKLKSQLKKEEHPKTNTQIACDIIDRKKYLRYKLYKDLLSSKYKRTTSYQ